MFYQENINRLLDVVDCLNRLLKVKEKSVEYFAFHNHIAIDNTLELCNIELKSI